MDSFATELLKELKASSKRWFIAFCIMVVLELLTIGGFFWYISLPVDESSYVDQTVDDIEDSEITQVGGEYNGNSTAD